MKLTFVTATNSSLILQQNLLSSPCLQNHHPHQIIIREGFSSAAAAYNPTISISENEIIVFIHQDVYLPENWVSDLGRAIRIVETGDPAWGVLGCFGARADRSVFGFLHTPGQGVIGSQLNLPAEVQTLDEAVLIIRKSSGLEFDERLPGFHLYGAGICLDAAGRGLNSYAIDAFCIHNSCQHLRLPPDFWGCCRALKRIHRKSLPIQTACIRLTRFSGASIKRRMKDFLHWALLLEPRCGSGPRVDNPLLIEDAINSKQSAPQ